MITKHSARGGLFSGPRAGTALIIFGFVLAAAAALLVVRIGNRSRIAAAQAVPQVYVVSAVKDVPEFTAIRADQVAVKPFPAPFAPPGAISPVEDAVGKFATTRIVQEQLVLESQVSTTRRSSNLSASIPPGKVAFWMPMPELLAQSGGLQAGDHVDILLTLPLAGTRPAGAPSQSGDQNRPLVTQNTLQNVEIFFVGAANSDVVSSATAVSQPVTAGKPAAKVIVFLLDPQDALVAKFINDSGGTIDLVLRSKESKGATDTEAVTADTLVDRFKFRVPERYNVGK